MKGIDSMLRQHKKISKLCKIFSSVSKVEKSENMIRGMTLRLVNWSPYITTEMPGGPVVKLVQGLACLLIVSKADLSQQLGV